MIQQIISLPGAESLFAPFKFASQPYEYKVTALKECPTPEQMQQCDEPQKVADYWRLHIVQNPYYNPDCETFAVLLLNTRRRVKGHQVVSIGTIDTILVHPREVFRAAIAEAAAGIIVVHNHPSGDPTPSPEDRVVTRQLVEAGQLLDLPVYDHVILGGDRFLSFVTAGLL